MKQITTNNYLTFIKSASVFTTGGGIPLRDQMQTVKRIKHFNVKLLSLSEFDKNAAICVVAELGPTSSAPIKKEKVITNMRVLLEKVIGRRLSGVYPPEIGQESVLLEAAHHLQLPIADFNPVGLRAVPYVDVNLFNVNDIPFSYAPMVVGNDQGEIFLVEGGISDPRLEAILRTLAGLSENKSIFVMGGVLSVKRLLKNNLANNPYSTIFSYGAKKTIQGLLTHLSPRIVLQGKVIRKEEKEIQGFFSEEIALETEKGRQVRLIVLNEVIFLLDENSKVIASVPERILLLNNKEPIGLSCTDIAVDSEITIVVIRPEKQWMSKRAQKIFGRERFAFLLP